MRYLPLLLLLALTACRNVGPKQDSDNTGARAEGTQGTMNFSDETWSSTTDRPSSALQQDLHGTNKFAHGQFFDSTAVVPYIPQSDTPPTFEAERVTEIIGYTEDGEPLTRTTVRNSPFLVRLMASDPANRGLEDFFAGLPDGWHMRLGSMTQNMSDVIAAYDTQQVESYKAQGLITEKEANVAIAQIQAGVSIFEALANAGVDVAKLFTPAGVIPDGD